MKTFAWMFLLQLIASTSYSQKFEPVNPRIDQREFQGYLIKLIPAFGGTYGYNILKGNELIAHQSHNPFNTSSIGLSRKEDVYNVAGWQINKYKNEKQSSRKNVNQSIPKQSVISSEFFYKPVPAEVAKELKIKISR